MRAFRKMFTFSCQAVLASIVVGAAVHNPWRGSSAHALAHPSSDALMLFIITNTLLVSSVLTVMVYAQLVHILRSYGNIFTRLLAAEALLLGFTTASIACVCALCSSSPSRTGYAIIADLLMISWLVFALRYHRNKQRYETQGCGPVPVDTCIKIPPQLPKPGDAIGTGGQMAKLLRQGVAHTETVIMWEGRPMLFSSWFENGAFLNEVSRILKPDPKYPNYWLQRRPALRPDQIELMEYVVRAMIRQNADYVTRLKAKRARLPNWLSGYLDKKFPVTGYDWLGRYTGRRAPDRWTCNVVYLEVMRRSGVEVVRLGQGAAGLRTGWFDIPNTEDLRGDDALHLVRNAEVPGLLSAVGTANTDVSSTADAAFEARVQSLIEQSTNIFAGRQRKG